MRIRVPRRSALVAIVLLASCVHDEDAVETAEWRDAPGYEEWRDQWPTDDTGAYVVEGDMVIRGEERMRRLYEYRYPRGSALTIDTLYVNGPWNRWPSPARWSLYYCVSDSFNTYGIKSELVEALNFAAAGWESAADVDFVYMPQYDATCTNTNTNVMFNVIPVVGLEGAADAFFPDDARADRELKIKVSDPSPYIFENMEWDYGRMLMKHELGHILGFVHEFIHDSLGGVEDCSGDDPSSAVLTGPDPYSVMMYQWALGCPYNPLYFTRNDLQGAQYVYGSPVGYDVTPGDFDGDLRTDLSIRFGRGGNWCIKYNDNSTTPIDDNNWDWCGYGYGTSSGSVTSQVAVGDYDGDDTDDLSMKSDYNGIWHVDLAWNGFGYWDATYGSRGGSEARVAPADYDGDNATDLSVKDIYGNWHIDYSSDGFGPWNLIRSGYGNASSVPVPGKYNLDQYADIAVKDNSTGQWKIDYAAFQHVWHANNGYAGFNFTGSGYGQSWSVPIPFDYDNDGATDISVKDTSGYWYIDYSVGGFGAWNVISTAVWGDGNWLAMPGRWCAGDTTGSFAVKRRHNSTVDLNWFINCGSDGYVDPLDEVHVLKQ